MRFMLKIGTVQFQNKKHCLQHKMQNHLNMLKYRSAHVDSKQFCRALC